MKRRNVASLHQTDQPGRSADVRYSGWTGSGWQRVETALLTQSRHRASEGTADAASRYLPNLIG